MQFVKLGSLVTAAALLAAMATPALADTTFPAVTQTAANGNNINNADPNTVHIRNDAADGAAGAVGLNATAGDGNQQTNQIILMTSQAANNSTAGTTGQSLTTQTLGGTSSGAGNVVQDAAAATSSIGDMTALNASGNVGANSAAGNLNQQANVLVLSNKPNVGGTVSYSGAVAGNTQTNFLNQGLLSNDASSAIDGSAALNGSGNIGLNSVAGALNQQANSLYAETPATGSIPNRNNDGAYPAPPGQSNEANYGAQVFANSNATIADFAASGARGNTALNTAAGLLNGQSNATILITGISGAIPPSTPGAGTRTFQEVYGSESDSAFVSRNSTINGNAAQNASGAVSINAISGIQNLQSNATIVLQSAGAGTPSSRLCTQCGDSQQIAGLVTSYDLAPNTNNSTIGDNALAGVRGLTAVNNGSGTLNEQVNHQILFNGSGTPTLATQGVFQVQYGGGSIQDSSFDFALVTGNAGSGVQGALDVNTLSGHQNQQMNQLISVTGNGPFGQPPGGAYVQQQQDTRGTQTVILNGAPGTARVDGNAFSGITGALNGNVAAGDLNQQGNVMLLQTSNLTDVAPGMLQQVPNVNISNTGPNPGAYSATVAGSALSGNTGAVNLNVTAGVGNQQANILQLSR